MAENWHIWTCGLYDILVFLYVIELPFVNLNVCRIVSNQTPQLFHFLIHCVHPVEKHMSAGNVQESTKCLTWLTFLLVHFLKEVSPDSLPFLLLNQCVTKLSHFSTA